MVAVRSALLGKVVYVWAAVLARGRRSPPYPRCARRRMRPSRPTRCSPRMSSNTSSERPPRSSDNRSYVPRVRCSLLRAPLSQLVRCSPSRVWSGLAQMSTRPSGYAISLPSRRATMVLWSRFSRTKEPRCLPERLATTTPVCESTP